ncbi:MAG: amino acid adenylation domain-containing protein [Verrucomicrobia bacterium]|nr:amino acid adenylation domain-containing protein [Verrucomicrobiota bacterium]
MKLGDFDIGQGLEQPRLDMSDPFAKGRHTTIEYPRDKTVHALFSNQAAATPNATAVVSDDVSLSYREVDELSNQVARFLIDRGLPPGGLVGVMSEQSPAWIVAMLAALKAGGVYVPINPELPWERIRYLLQDTQADFLITDRGQAEKRARLNEELPDLPTLVCDASSPATATLKVVEPVRQPEARDGTTDRDDWQMVLRQPWAPLEERNGPTDLAYVLYTSGTSGKPKGVMVEHRSLVNLSCDAVRAFELTCSDRFVQFAAISFDASLYEVFMAFACGGTLLLTSRETLRDPRQFTAYLERQQVTVINPPPAYLSLLDLEHLDSLRTIITGGETPKVDIARGYAQTKTYINAYGPTETCVCCTHLRVDALDDYPAGIPIGTPIANTRCYVLDERDELAEAGAVGELCVSGECLARGYWNDPSLTDEKFVSNPFEPGSRMYRTGDLVKRLPNGELLFVGRADDQLKIRGYRIEPAEIEHAMLEHPELEDASVLPRQGATGDQELIGCFTTKRRLQLWPSLSEFLIYDELLYGVMASHQDRNEAYRRVFKKLLPGKTVVEIGPGPEAVLARMCIEAGAERVYAIERLDAAYQRACKKVRSLGLEDRIVLIQGDAREAEIPMKVDYCVSEVVGAIGGCEGAAKLINHARRFLHDPSRMIPQRSVTKLAAISLPADFEFAFADEVAAGYVERVFEDKGYQFDLRVCLKNLSPQHFLSTSDVFEDLDFTGESPLEERHEIRLTFTRGGLVHGLCAWMQLGVDQNNILDIFESPHSWLPVYFPLWLEGLPVEEGDTIVAEVHRNLSANQLNPDYHIRGSLVRRDCEVVAIEYSAYHEKPQFRHSPFYQRLFAQEIVPRAKVVSTEDLTMFLKQKLPEYMVPQRLVRIEEFPRTLHGKIDKAALAKIEQEHQATDETEQPWTETEKQLALIWEEVLKQKITSPTQDFFRSGGHSLKVTKLVALIRERIGVHVSLTAVFKATTIREQAKLLLDQAQFGIEGVDEPMVLLNKTAGGAAIFALPPGTGDALAYLQLADLLKPYRFYAFNFIPGPTRLADYADLIMSADPAGPYLLLGWSAGGNLAFHVADELERRGRCVSDIVMVESGRRLHRLVLPEGEGTRVAQMFLNQESIRPHVSSAVLWDKVTRQIESYYEFLSSTTDNHTVDANIHLLVTATSKDYFDLASGELMSSFTRWSEVTRRAFATYLASGEHNFLLYPPSVEPNARLLRVILDEAFVARRQESLP